MLIHGVDFPSVRWGNILEIFLVSVGGGLIFFPNTFLDRIQLRLFYFLTLLIVSHSQLIMLCLVLFGSLNLLLLLLDLTIDSLHFVTYLLVESISFLRVVMTL